MGSVILACTVAEGGPKKRVWALGLGFVWFELPIDTTRRSVQVFLSAFLSAFAPDVGQKGKKEEWGSQAVNGSTSEVESYSLLHVV